MRDRLRAGRRRLAAAAPEAAAHAAAAFADVDLRHGLTVALYRPQGAELDPWALAARLRAQGAHLALPVAVAADAPLLFRLPLEGAALPPDAAGVPAPGPEAPEVTPDLVVTPLLAFDGTGARLGQGGGYYDRTLGALRARGRVAALGLAYAGQEVERLPAEPHDQRLDAVLTEVGLRVFGPIWPP
ncbi:MAG: 5-formyltetrahydrofolate cyclo-ligase [Caulobacteraceae bacterium]|nr:5-formyltetrahydrofolate cyclo-ligase [Caulobacter sp.]